MNDQIMTLFSGLSHITELSLGIYYNKFVTKVSSVMSPEAWTLRHIYVQEVYGGVFWISTHGKGGEGDWAEGGDELEAMRARILPKGSCAQLILSHLDTKWVETSLSCTHQSLVGNWPQGGYVLC